MWEWPNIDSLLEYDPVTPADASVAVADSGAKAAESLNQASDKLSRAIVGATIVGGATLVTLFVASKVLK